MNSAGKETRYYSLDLWRGVACLLVVLYHSSYYVTENPNLPKTGGLGQLIFRAINHFDVGVPMFFVISGYCITAACEASRKRSQPTRQYFLRRLRRIFPPFWAAFFLLLAAVSAAIWFRVPQLYLDHVHPVHDPSSFSAWQWFGNISLTEIWRSHVAGDRSWFWLGPSWSLCYEEQFYVVCGLLLLFSRKAFFRGAFWLTGLVVALSIVRGIIPLPIDGFFIDGYWLLFASGILVYYRIHVATEKRGWCVPALAGAAIIAVLWRVISNQTIAEHFYVGFLFAWLLVVAHRWDIAIASNALLRPFTYCGIMCYSIYLVHWPVVKPVTHLLYVSGVQGCWPTLIIAIPVALAGALGVGIAFHFLIERRFLNTPPMLPWEAIRRRASSAPVSQSGNVLPVAPPSVSI